MDTRPPSSVPQPERGEYYLRRTAPRGAITFLVCLSILSGIGLFLLGWPVIFLGWSVGFSPGFSLLNILLYLFFILLVASVAAKYRGYHKREQYETWRKNADFLAGFLGTVLLGFILNLVAGFGMVLGGTYVALAFPVILFSLVAFAFHRANRRYVVTGMLSALLIPILVFGACLYVLGNL